MAGFFSESPPVTISSSELERHQGYAAPKSYRCPLCFTSLLTLPLRLWWEPYPRCFPNMTHSSAHECRERVQMQFPAHVELFQCCWKGQSRQAKAQLGPIANVFKPLQSAQSGRVFFFKHSNYTIWLYLHRQGHAVLQHRVQQSLITAKFFVRRILRAKGKWYKHWKSVQWSSQFF